MECSLEIPTGVWQCQSTSTNCKLFSDPFSCSQLSQSHFPGFPDQVNVIPALSVSGWRKTRVKIVTIVFSLCTTSVNSGVPLESNQIVFVNF